MPIQQIALYCQRSKMMLAIAESCTGGLIAARCTEEPGASLWFSGAIIAYNNQLKQQYLGVEADSLMRFGAVSEPVVEQMARGVQRAFNAHCSIATSGIAGPGGGSKEKPVGTVCIAVCAGKVIEKNTFYFRGNRGQIRETSVAAALDMLLKLLKRTHEKPAS